MEKLPKSMNGFCPEGEVATIGITDHAQSELGDIVFVELPEVGTKVTAGGEMATVESFKAASSVYAGNR